MSFVRMIPHRSGLCLALVLAMLAFAGCEDRDQEIQAEYDKIQKDYKAVQPGRNPRIEIIVQKPAVQGAVGEPPKVQLMVELLEDTYPEAVNRFVALLNDGYYGENLLIKLPSPDERNKLSDKPQLQFTTASSGSKSGFNGVYTADAKSATGVNLSHQAAGLLTVPKMGLPNAYGFTITREPDASLDPLFLPIGVVIAGKDQIGMIGNGWVVKEIKINRTSKEPALYALSKNEVPVPALPAKAVKPAPKIIGETEMPEVLIDTDLGKIKVQLNEDAAPNTVGNFMHLALTDFYDNGVFHRIEGWVVQGGDPTGTGAGGPGYNFGNEIDWDSLGLTADQKTQLTNDGFKSTPGLQSLHNDTGMVAMAHAGPNTNGSQFYFLRRDTRQLDGKHTVFGKVIEGMDVLNKFQNGTKVNIKSITVLSRRAHKYVAGNVGPSKEPDPALTAPPAAPVAPVTPPAAPADGAAVPAPAPAAPAPAPAPTN